MKTDRVLGPEECQGSAKFQSGAKLSPAFPRKSCPNHEMHVKCSPSFPRLGLIGAMVSATTLCAQEVATTSQDEAADVAKKLSNPVASLISVPFQSNFEFGGGLCRSWLDATRATE
jgi:hypothetical protein